MRTPDGSEGEIGSLFRVNRAKFLRAIDSSLSARLRLEASPTVLIGANCVQATGTPIASERPGAAARPERLYMYTSEAAHPLDKMIEI